MNPDLRFRILQRDNESCTECGKSNLPLEVHHIIPVSEGGLDSLQNLRALCRSCHRKIEPSRHSENNNECERHTVSLPESTYQRLLAHGRCGQLVGELVEELLSKLESAQMATPLRMVER